mgnify:CR=1 FL=1
MPGYSCIRCGYETKLKGDIKRHFNRKKHCPPKLNDIPLIKYKEGILNGINFSKCNFCEKITSDSDEHMCSKQQTDDSVEALKQLVETLNKKIDQDREEMKELRELVKRAGVSQNITNHNTQNITNNIVILPYRDTDVSHLKGRDYYRALSRCVMSVPQLITDTHFNPKKPENHNIYISNISRAHAMVWDGSKWVIKNQNEVIEGLIEENEYRIEDWVKDGSKKYPKAMDKFEKYIEKRDSKGVPELIRKEIKMMLYNNRGMVSDSKKTKETN